MAAGDRRRRERTHDVEMAITGVGGNRKVVPLSLSWS